MNTRTELLPPEVPETTVSPDLLQPLQIFSQLIIQAVGKDLAVFAILHILLPVEEPVWDFVLARILHDGHHTLDLLLSQLSGPLVQVDVGFPQDNMSVTSANTLDGSDGEGDLPPTIDVRVQDTKNVLELLRDDQRSGQ